MSQRRPEVGAISALSRFPPVETMTASGRVRRLLTKTVEGFIDDVASSFGAAGALIVLLLWIFYSTLIFLLGAEFTRAWTHVYGARRGSRPRQETTYER